MHLDNFFKGGYESNEQKKEYKNLDFIARLLTNCRYVDLNGYMRVNHKFLGPAYQRVVKRLEAVGTLERDREFVIGETPCGYKLDLQQCDLDKLDEVIDIQKKEGRREKPKRIYLDEGSQRLSLERVDMHDSIKDHLNIDFFRNMVANRMAPIRIEGDYIVTPTGKHKSIMFHFQNPKSYHIITEKETRRPRNASMLQKHVDSGNCYWYMDSQHKEYVVIGDPDLFLEATAQVLLTQAVSFYMKIKHKDWYCYMIETNRREYHTLTNMPSWMKRFLLIDGKLAAEADLANAQPLQWATDIFNFMERGEYEPWRGTELEGVQDYGLRVGILKKTMREALIWEIEGELESYGRISWCLDQHPENTGFRKTQWTERITPVLEQLNATEDIDRYIDEERGVSGLYLNGTLILAVPTDLKKVIMAATSGRFYDVLAESAGLASRAEAKVPTLKVAYDIVRNDKMNKIFNSVFPTIKGFVDWRKTVTSNKEFACYVQGEESDAWGSAKNCMFFDYDIAFVGVHDSVCCPHDEMCMTSRILRETLIDTYWMGFTIKITNYNE